MKKPFAEVSHISRSPEDNESGYSALTGIREWKMIRENEYFSDSFRALSPEKLGLSVLQLCAERDDPWSSTENYDETALVATAEKE